MPPDYSNRELDQKFDLVLGTLGRIEAQTIKTNGRVTKLERNLTVVAVILATTVALKYEEVMTVVKLFL